MEILLVIALVWGGVLGLQGAATALKKGISDRRRAVGELKTERSLLEARSSELHIEVQRQQTLLEAQSSELQLKQAATQEAEQRLVELGERLKDPALTPQTLFSDVAAAVSDYVQLQTNALADHLATKDRPARRAAEDVRDQARRLRAATLESRFARYQIALYEREAPWLVDFLEAEYPAPDDALALSADDDPSRRYLSAAEYAQLSSVERNQLALDRYWRAAKSSWQVGRDYERYVGYLWEARGYAVEYHGIQEGLHDLGRDLLARRGNDVSVIQCKHWATFRTVRERHVYQLFGTALELALSLRGEEAARPELTLFPDLLAASRVQPVLVTSACLSTKARAVAAALGVGVEEGAPMRPYPSIKCNVARGTDERIYHLPFDQQYDNTCIEPQRGERYVSTAAEAETLGFRRAFRWRGDRDSAA